MNDVSFSYVDEEQFFYIWDNLREHDRIELTVVGVTRENAIERMSWCDETQIGSIDGVPLAVIGYVTTAATIRFNFFATDECDKHWLLITRMSKAYVQYNIKKHPHLRPIIEVWEGHSTSVRWLKLLGFKPTGAYRHTPFGKMLFVEYR